MGTIWERLVYDCCSRCGINAGRRPDQPPVTSCQTCGGPLLVGRTLAETYSDSLGDIMSRDAGRKANGGGP